MCTCMHGGHSVDPLRYRAIVGLGNLPQKKHEDGGLWGLVDAV
jgi:hypothetical protein